ncbi:putative lipoate--protein ligase [Pichia kluyveri]|uniref:Putative lipoate-protein ligase A n=1 Tax=Pichia kluyveri TaxID=36015 RepID=A0AAV5R0W7_PICKL|nr:putative lipoate--protein ligase [Pichia kluyveri]
MFCRRILGLSLRQKRYLGSSSSGIPNNFTISSQPTKHNNTNNNNNKNTSFNLETHDIAETLQNDPNLELFYDAKTLNEVNNLNNPKPETFDPYDFSSLPTYTTPDNNITHSIDNEPQTMSTEDFMKMLAADNAESPDGIFFSDKENNHASGQTTDQFLESMIQNDTTISEEKVVSSSTPKPQPTNTIFPTTPNLELLEFLKRFEIPEHDILPNLKPIETIINTDLPLIVISKLTDPRLNLSIEKYIYDNFPDPKNPINRFARRLVLYKNSNCIVLGKNQNIFREVNLRLASTLSIPILRRFSGGGTVVHDLGNYNFSFMCNKNEFSRTGFTQELIQNWNQHDPHNLDHQLTVNDKGDMVRQIDLKKVSGSAFQISKGKSLHHGTMLLNSDLKTLGKLLKLNETRASNISDNATNSIPSPIVNTKISEDDFINIITTSFTNKFGLPTNLNVSKINKYDNLYLHKLGNVECQILKIDDLIDLPSEILETYNQLKSWDWIFGKSPKFNIKINLDNDSLKLKFFVDKGRIITLEYDKLDDNDTRLDSLIAALSNKDEVVNFSSKSLSMYIKESSLMKELSWHVDQSLNYGNIGISH